MWLPTWWCPAPSRAASTASASTSGVERGWSSFAVACTRGQVSSWAGQVFEECQALLRLRWHKPGLHQRLQLLSSTHAELPGASCWPGQAPALPQNEDLSPLISDCWSAMPGMPGREVLEGKEPWQGLALNPEPWHPGRAHRASDRLRDLHLVRLLEALSAAGGQQVLPQLRRGVRVVLQTGPACHQHKAPSWEGHRSLSSAALS